jgi:Holliday junction DNA helicase RuvA
MISFLRGKITRKLPTYLEIEVNNIGYGIRMPLSAYDQLGAVGEEAHVFTYLYVRENCLDLYGFITIEEKDMFVSLLTVSGIGPRVALALISGLSILRLKEAIDKGDVNALTKVPGVGKKTASRIILELKDKLVIKHFGPKEGPVLPEEALEALISLGCRKEEARKAVQKACDNLEKDARIELIVKEAMKHI